ncbi:MAG: phage minor capsid protein, partial [Akkermansia sp.]|nr:phage minor capsid protein [Akkermansia sp.]
MALDPKLLNSLPDTLVEMYGLVEIDILADMARRISTYDYFIPAAQHQLQKLQELGAVQSDIIAKLSAMTGKTQEEIVALLTEASAQAIADDVEYYTAAEVYEPTKVNTEALHAQLNSGLLQTEQAFFNITGTTANTASKQFELALDRAWTQINTGGFDYTTAIRNAIKDLSAAGVGSIEYKSGRVDNIETAVRRALVTGANQTAMKTQEVLADELGVDLVEVSAHSGARPEHAKWQGKVYGRKGRVTVDGVTYESLKKGTGYGSAGGLGGINCRHNFHPYVPGTSRTWSDKQLAALDDKNIEYNGKMYSEYEASQIQRGIEREIRKQKRIVASLEAVGEDASTERKA